ncbi:thioesterase family protein [Tabrizicola sp. YIM 78059]|uniref:thioesterase family protein n=1 Tax=Tabrizicola sp. YIM 78059 TaxID=2529861 RepID=UPI0010AA9CD5|nr:thioesterase family protein [Tabrizicola sp. YIM 78059]
MKPGLAIGDRAEFRHRIGAGHTVPALYPESAFFRAMPGVFATGYMVGLMEWACIEQLAPHYEQGEGSLGTYVDVSHVAPTPPGLTVKVETEVTAVEGRFVWFRVRAHDGVDMIGEGRHQRALVRWDKFVPKAMAKAGTGAEETV